jgi:hypothetical protein
MVKRFTASLINSTFFDRDIVQIIFLLLITFIAHGLFFPWLGFYGDDWGFLWLSYQARTPELLITKSRFFLPELFTLISKFLPALPIAWHLFYLSIYILSVVNNWILQRMLWRGDTRKIMLISLLYALYPGALMSMQPVTYWFLFFQANLLFISFWMMLKSLESGKPKWFYAVGSLLLSAFNLALTEYFYFLDLLRILILYLYYQRNGENVSIPKKTILKQYLPYLLVFVVFSIIRFFNQRQLSGYYRVDTGTLLSNPVQMLFYLASRVLTDIPRNGLTTWVQPIFDAQLYENSGRLSIMLFFAISLLSAGLLFMFSHGSAAKKEHSKQDSLQIILFGLAGVFLSNIPFWLGNLDVDVGVGVFSRFSIPAAFSSAFLVYGIVEYFLKDSRWASVLFSLIGGLSIMMHLLTGNLFRKEWEHQNRFYWEMAWRMPHITAGTTILSNVTPVWMVTENTLSAAINWIYMDEEPPVATIDYYLYYDLDKFLSEVPEEKDSQFVRGHYAGVFSGNSSNVMVIFHQPPACLEVVNTTWDRYNLDIPLHLRETAQRFPVDLILPEGEAEQSLASKPIFLAETRNNFCYYYQKGSLAAQQADWESAIALWQEAQQRGFRPNHAAERIPFMQAFAHTGQYEQAFGLSMEMLKISTSYQPMACSFWQENLKEGGLDAAQINQHAQNDLNCDFNSLE